MRSNETARYLRVKAVAERFDVSPSTIYRAIEAGELEAVRIGGTVRISADAVDAFEARTAAVDSGAGEPGESGSSVVGVV